VTGRVAASVQSQPSSGAGNRESLQSLLRGGASAVMVVGAPGRVAREAGGSRTDQSGPRPFLSGAREHRRLTVGTDAYGGP
jgi:hypothetical protein